MKKQLLEDCQRLHMRQVSAAIPKNATSLILDVGKGQLEVIGRLTNLNNGYRYYFLCPKCSKPYESLFISDFGSWLCRVCTGAVYASTRTK